MKKIILNLLFIVSVSIIVTGCDPENVIKEKTSTGKTETPDDYVWNDANVKTITFNGNSITASASDVKINGTTATITTAGQYLVSGSLTDGQLIVNAPKSKLKIMLDGVTMTNSTTGPFFIQAASKVIVFLKSGATNTFSDAATYTHTGEPQSTIFSNAYLAFTGNGILNVTGNHNDAISSDDEIYINNGNINIKAADDGIRAKDYMVIHNGNINITSDTGHALKADSTGTQGHGYVKIDGGNFTLASTSGDGINAYKRILIENGKFTIVSNGSQALRSDSLVLISGGEITVPQSRQGIKSPYITLTGGTTRLTTSKTAVNATFGAATTQPDNSRFTVSGGNLYINTLNNGIVSDGDININGGTTIVQGPYDNTKVPANCKGEFKFTNGVFVGSGPNAGALIKNPSNSSTQNVLKITSPTLGSNLINIQDGGGNSLLTFKPIKSAYYLIVSLPGLKTGNSYSLYSGGSYSGGATANGYSTGGAYTAGTKVAAFTVRGNVTEVNF